MVTVETKPNWNSSSFLIYLGGLTVGSASVMALIYLAMQYHGSGERTAWALLIFVILAAIAHAFRRAGRWLPAGIFAFITVEAWGYLVGLTLYWWGWENGSFRDFTVWSWPRLLFEVLVLLAATAARWRFKFPFIRAISAGVGVLFVVDLVTKGHGEPLAIVALLLGLVYLFAGHVSDKPSTFWLHLTAGVLIGAPIIYWCHHSTFDYTVLAFMSLVYVIWAYWTKRSSWAVYATIGFFIPATHFVSSQVTSSINSAEFSGQSPISVLWFIPLAIGLLGFWLVLLGMLGRRKKGEAVTRVQTETKPVWNASSVLVYSGGFTVLLGSIVGLIYLATQYHGKGAITGWTLLYLAVIYGIAHALRLRGRWLAAGMFAFVSVLVWATLVFLAMRWIGWHPFNVVFGGFGLSLSGIPIPSDPLSTWSWSRMLLWVLILAAAWYDRRVFKFPFIRAISAVVFWFFAVDLLTSAHGDWFVVVSLLTGLAYLAVGTIIDTPSAFWLHLVGGALIAGAVLHWFNTGDGDFAVIAIVSALFVLVAFRTKRSSWAVFGALGFFAATDHYLSLAPHSGPVGPLLGASQQCISNLRGTTVCTSSGPSLWSVALGYGLLGFFLVALGMLGKWKSGAKPVAVVVTTPPPPAPAAATAPLAE